MIFVNDNVMAERGGGNIKMLDLTFASRWKSTKDFFGRVRVCHCQDGKRVTRPGLGAKGAGRKDENAETNRPGRGTNRRDLAQRGRNENPELPRRNGEQETAAKTAVTAEMRGKAGETKPQPKPGMAAKERKNHKGRQNHVGKIIRAKSRRRNHPPCLCRRSSEVPSERGWQAAPVVIRHPDTSPSK